MGCVLVLAIASLFHRGFVQDPLPVVSEVASGSSRVLVHASGAAIAASGMSSGGGVNSSSDQILTTTIQDPNHPEEPWVVTTYRRDGESLGAFIKRHREMVDAVRDALEEP